MKCIRPYTFTKSLTTFKTVSWKAREFPSLLPLIQAKAQHFGIRGMFCWLIFTFFEASLGLWKNPNTLGAVHLIMYSLIHWFIQPSHRSGMDQVTAALRSQRQASVTGHGSLPLDRNRFLQFFFAIWMFNSSRSFFSMFMFNDHKTWDHRRVALQPAVYTTVPGSKGSITESSMWPNSLAKHVPSLFSNVPAAPSWSPRPIQ